MQSLFSIYKNWTIYKIISNYVKSYKTISNRGVFGTQSNIYGGVLWEEVNNQKSLTIFAEKLQHRFLVAF